MTTTISYLDAPATALLDVRCACCGKALLDAVSVEVGIGPICRLNYLDDVDASDVDRKVANVLIHEAALVATTASRQVEIGAALVALGFVKVAARIEVRWTKRAEKELAAAQKSATIRIEALEDGFLSVETPYVPEFVNDLKAEINSADRRWNKADKRWEITRDAARGLWTVLRAHFAGSTGFGPKGAFEITAA